MKKLTTTIAALMLYIGAMAQQGNMAEDNNGNEPVKILAKRQCCPARCDIEYNRKTNKSTGIWDSMEMGYITDECEVEAPIAKDFNQIFPGATNGLSHDYALLYWMLTEENDETVLHCYFTMPADKVVNMWLACEETAIVDMATGTQYRARRTAPECFRKHFSVEAPVGTALDFRIYFPKLDPDTKEIAIYGVPMWNMRGDKIPINSTTFYGNTPYDNIPQIKEATLVKADNNYNKDKHETWAVYSNPHLIKPVQEGTMALWRTREATYIAVAHEQNWMREYYALNQGTMLMDNRGHQYKLKKLHGLPVGQQFWIEGNSGDFIAFLMEFDPLPANVSSFTFLEPDSEDFDMWGADPEGQVIPNLNVEFLRKNQRIFEPIERTVKQ